jgi:TIR domain
VASIREYFDKAFQYVVTTSRQVSVGSGSAAPADIAVQVHLDFDAHTRYLSLFVPRHENWVAICQFLFGQCGFLAEAKGDVNVKLPPAQYIYGGYKIFNGSRAEITAHPLCEPAIQDLRLPFSGTVFIYSENEATQAEIDALREFALKHAVRLRWRGPDFARERSLMEKPVAFISHDTRDKQDVARPLAIRLQQMLCPVWFDEFSLGVGDSLRGKIEEGLKQCAKCILVLSPNFLDNTGWTKTEFNSIFTREILENENVILPVWFGVTAKNVYSYCPSLADRVALDWNLGVDEVARRLYGSISKSTPMPTESKWKPE